MHGARFFLVLSPPATSRRYKQIVGFVHVSGCRDADKDPTHVGEVTALYVEPTFWR